MRNGSRTAARKTRLLRDGVEPSGGNVFADLGLPNPDAARAKAQLVQRIRRILAERRLTQAEAARLLGVDQPKVSALIRGRVDGFGLERLFRFLNALGQEVAVAVRPTRLGSTERARPVKVA